MATKKADVSIGDVWTARLSTGRMARVRITGTRKRTRGFGVNATEHTVWDVEDIDTHRTFTVESAMKFRRKVTNDEKPAGSTQRRFLQYLDKAVDPKPHVDLPTVSQVTAAVSAQRGEDRTPSRLERDVREWLEANPHRYSSYEEMTPWERLDTFLHWNGIIGYTNTVLEAVEQAYGVAIFFPAGVEEAIDRAIQGVTEPKLRLIERLRLNRYLQDRGVKGKWYQEAMRRFFEATKPADPADLHP